MRTLPLISVIIPTHNCAAYLPEALDSVLSQTYPNIEILVIDDGSTDNTAAIMAAYAEDSVYIRQERLGPSCARNRGIAKATGTYLAFLDADDIWLPSKLEKQLLVLNNTQNWSSLFAKCGFFRPDWRRIGRLSQNSTFWNAV